MKNVETKSLSCILLGVVFIKYLLCFLNIPNIFVDGFIILFSGKIGLKRTIMLLSIGNFLLTFQIIPTLFLYDTILKTSIDGIFAYVVVPFSVIIYSLGYVFLSIFVWKIIFKYTKIGRRFLKVAGNELK